MGTAREVCMPRTRQAQEDLASHRPQTLAGDREWIHGEGGYLSFESRPLRSTWQTLDAILRSGTL